MLVRAEYVLWWERFPPCHVVLVSIVPMLFLSTHFSFQNSPTASPVCDNNGNPPSNCYLEGNFEYCDPQGCSTAPYTSGCPCSKSWDCKSNTCAGIPPTCQ